MATALASILHRETLEKLVDAGTFSRGVSYVRRNRVVELERSGASLTAKVRGTEDYVARIWVRGTTLASSCSCPMGEEGAFCKHLVAVSLAWLERDGSLAAAAGLGASTPLRPAAALEVQDLRHRLDRLEKAQLVELMLGEATRSPSLRQRLQTLTVR